jgi:hypothetical protein
MYEIFIAPFGASIAVNRIGKIKQKGQWWSLFSAMGFFSVGKSTLT